MLRTKDQREAAAGVVVVLIPTANLVYAGAVMWGWAGAVLFPVVTYAGLAMMAVVWGADRWINAGE